MSNNAHDLTKRLLNALDSNYNVVDMHAVSDIISLLEKINITKELLETTRLGKHVNELRRKAQDPTLARRAKVLVKRWRDLVIPGAAQASPAHSAGSNRASAERQVRLPRMGGTPLTSPALIRQVLSPAVPSPRPPSRPAWGGYESDSQDVILVDDDTPPPPPAPPADPSAPQLTPSRRAASPQPPVDLKRAKRDKKPKKRRGHSRAGAETVVAEPPAPVWSARNGVTSPAQPALAPSHPPPPPHHPARRNGCRRPPVDAYSTLINRMPAAGAKKVKTTKELLEDIQSRGAPTPSPAPPSPGDPASPDVMLIENDPCPLKVSSPLRNGGSPAPRPPSPQLPVLPPAPARIRSPLPPLEDEREHWECTCGEVADEDCPAARGAPLVPRQVHLIHHAYVPGVNGTRAPPAPHRFAVRKPLDPERPELFASVVPLYRYLDYADDYCVKNVRVPLCTHIPVTEFAPSPPPLPAPPTPPPVRPYPLPATPEIVKEVNGDESSDSDAESETPKPLPETIVTAKSPIKEEIVTPVICVPLPSEDDQSDRLKAPLLSSDEEKQRDSPECMDISLIEADASMEAEDFETESQEHRTVERTKEVESPKIDGRTLYNNCERAIAAVPFSYSDAFAAPTVTFAGDEEALRTAFSSAEEQTERDDMGRPLRATNFSEWHESAQLGDLIALPYCVID